MSESNIYYCTIDIPYVDSKGIDKVIKAGMKFLFQRDLGERVILTRWNKPFIIEKEFIKKGEK